MLEIKNLHSGYGELEVLKGILTANISFIRTDCIVLLGV